jgi:ABC-type dipeptide/oligopeptide/nickel transport system ATPase subunit
VTEASGASFHVKHAVGFTEYEALLIGGRSGVGKSTVGWEVSAQLQDRSVAHCLIEGDFLDQAYPPPEGDPGPQTGSFIRFIESGHF